MTIRQWVLCKIAEECAEVAQRASKSSLFGELETQPGQEETNAQRLAEEVKDLLCVLEMGRKQGLFQGSECAHYCFIGPIAEPEVLRRAEKLTKYLRYAQDLGYVDFPTVEEMQAAAHPEKTDIGDGQRI